MTPKEAQAELEKGLANIYDFDEAVAWLDAHPEVAKKKSKAVRKPKPQLKLKRKKK